MKNVMIIILIAGTAFFADAQPSRDTVRMLKPEVSARIHAARAAYLTERLKLTPEEAERFWPIYREFADKRRDIRRQYRDARRAGKDEKELINLGLEIRQQELDLEKEYSGRMLEAISADKLVQLRNAEREFTRIVLRQVHQRRPQMDRRPDFRERHKERRQQRQ